MFCAFPPLLFKQVFQVLIAAYIIPKLSDLKSNGHVFVQDSGQGLAERTWL